MGGGGGDVYCFLWLDEGDTFLAGTPHLCRCVLKVITAEGASVSGWRCQGVWFFHCLLTIFPLEANKQSVGRRFKTMQINILLPIRIFHPTPRFGTRILPEPILAVLMVAKWWVSNSSTSSTFTRWCSEICKQMPALVFQLFIHFSVISLDSRILIFSVAYNSLLCVIIFGAWVSGIWPVRVPSSWLLCSSGIHCLFF